MPHPADFLKSAFEYVAIDITCGAYQELVLKEPESAVRQPLKEAFLSLRLAAESAGVSEENEDEPDSP